jgi:TPR repeat protein
MLISAYKLLKQAADLGHIGAKEELAFAHLIGVHLPMDFHQAYLYFDEGVLTGSAPSHFVCQTAYIDRTILCNEIDCLSCLGTLLFA